MSGGSSDRSPFAPQTSDCNIVERTPLNSPKPAVVGTLVPSDVLDVDFDPTGTTVVAKKGGAIAGSLTPHNLAELIDCMSRGRKYKAIVLKVSGGLVELEIRPK